MAVTIGAAGLVKRYGEQRALDGFDLEVSRGTVFGLLGPNGAGKTTAVRSFATLLRYDAGSARVAGRDPATEPHEVRRRIGLSGQTPAVDEILGGRQNLVLFGRLNRMTRRDARRRADELLGQFGLADAAEKQVKHYSGGMRRRLDLAVTLLLRPEVLFLDEPTTGLDPRNRTEVWEAVRSLAADGTTVLLTTQYLDEADQLAGRVAVMEAGKVIAEGTPDELKRDVGGDQLEVVVEESPHDVTDLDRVREAVSRYSAGRPHVDHAERRVSAPVDDRVAAMAGVLRELQEHRVAIEDVALRKPTLDDVFLRLTGHAAESRTDGDVSAAEGGAPGETTDPRKSTNPHTGEESN